MVFRILKYSRTHLMKTDTSIDLKMLLLCFICALFFGCIPTQGNSKVCKTNSIVDCGPEFHWKCNCGCKGYYEKLLFVVNCTDIGYKNTSVLEHLPSQTEVLIFTGNTIEELPWNVFGTLNNYSELQVVDMSNNGLREIRGKSYHRVSNVKRLLLNHNMLTVSDNLGDYNHHHPRIFSNFVNLEELHLTDAFADNTPEELAKDLHDIFIKSNLDQLLRLHLEQNEIKRFIDSEIFCDLPSLMDLYLGDNLLKELDFNVKCLSQLRFLDLEKNEIKVLHSRDLEILDAFPSRNQTLMVDLSNNPFSCDCGVKELYAWLQKTRVEVRNKETLRCHHGLPNTNSGESVLGLRQIQCATTGLALEMDTHNHAIPVLIGFLISLVIVLIGVLVFMNRGQIKHHLSPILDSVSRKVQYTSIGKQEESEMDV